MLRLVPEAVEPEAWTLAFHTTTPYWWLRCLAVGRYKHVSAFAFVPALRVWIVYDVTLTGTRLRLLSAGEGAERWLAEMTADADLLHIQVRARAIRRPMLAPFSCTAALRHLIGLPGGALRPDALWRDCLRHGGKPYGTRCALADDRPSIADAADAGESGPACRGSGPPL